MGRVALGDIADAELRRAFLQSGLHDALDGLHDQATPNWGVFNPQQMAEHLIWSFDVSLGNVLVSCNTPLDKIDRFKKFLYSDLPTRQNFRNPVLGEQPPPLLLPDLGAAKKVLKEKVDQFYSYYQQPKQQATHPVFGVLNFEEWERSHFKHGIHHLEQFDLI